MKLIAKQFLEKLKFHSSKEVAVSMKRYFKQNPDDVFIGVKMGDVFRLAKEFSEMELDEVEKLMESEIHEARAGAVSILDYIARKKKTTPEKRKEIYDLYLKRHDRIDNWDLVDRAAIYVIGGYLADKDRDILYKLAKSKNMWERRTNNLST
jgi:3-methyladenine DNA glycosylase AlkD